MKTLCIILTINIFCISSYAQSKIIHSKYISYSGFIGKSKIVMDLQYGDNVVTGIYYYANHGEPILIYEGHYSDTDITLYARPLIKLETFHGKIDREKKTITGTWNIGENEKIVPFNIEQKHAHEFEIDYYSGVYKIKKDTALLVQVQGLKFDKLNLQTGIDSINKYSRNPNFELLKGNNGLLSMDEMKPLEVQSNETDKPTFVDEEMSFVLEDSSLGIDLEQFTWTKFNEIYNWDSNFIAINHFSHEYFGGHEMNNDMSFTTFDLKTGKPVYIEDCFIKGFNRAFNKLLGQAFEEYENAMTASDSSYRNYFQSGSDVMLYGDDYYFTSMGIVASYMHKHDLPNPTSFVFIPYSRLKKYIEPNGPLKWVLNH